MRNIFPKRASERFAFLFLICATTASYFLALLVIVPHIHGIALFTWTLHAICATFIVANIFGNLYYMITTETSTRGKVMPATLEPGWHFCVVCEACSPPRSLHCGICQRCILRRDHHCVFGGCCIGLNNLRYFFMLMLYLVVGCLYASILYTFYIWTLLGGFTLGNFVMHMFSVMSWLLGYLQFRIASQCFLAVSAETGFLYVLGLLVFHLRLLFQNQTIFEHNRSIRMYDLGWKQNLVDNLGDKWYLVWIFPTIKSRLACDGIRYRTIEQSKMQSDKTK